MCRRAITALRSDSAIAREAISVTWFVGVLECYRQDDFDSIRFGGRRYFAKLDAAQLSDAIHQAHQQVSPSVDRGVFCTGLIGALETFRSGAALTTPPELLAFADAVPFLEALIARLGIGPAVAGAATAGARA